MLIWHKYTRNRICLSKSINKYYLITLDVVCLKLILLFVFRENNIVIEETRCTSLGSKRLILSSRYAQTGWEQFKACLWKQHLSYWRNPSYNLTRIIFMCFTSMLCGILFWQKAKEMFVSSPIFLESALNRVISLVSKTLCSEYPLFKLCLPLFFAETISKIYSTCLAQCSRWFYSLE